MIFLKSITAGVIAAVAASVLWVIGEIAVTVVRASIASSDFGGLGAVSTGITDSLVFVAPIAFCVGCYWQFRRSQRAQ